MENLPREIKDLIIGIIGVSTFIMITLIVTTPSESKDTTQPETYSLREELSIAKIQLCRLHELKHEFHTLHYRDELQAMHAGDTKKLRRINNERNKFMKLYNMKVAGVEILIETFEAAL